MNWSDYFNPDLLPDITQLEAIWEWALDRNFIDEVSEVVKRRSLALLAMSSSRHWANWQDPDVKYLNELELSFILYWNSQMLALSRNIIIDNDVIRIGRYVLDRFDSQIDDSDTTWVYITSDFNCLFEYDKAVQFLASQWKELPTKSDWTAILDLLPCSDEELRSYMAKKILNLSSVWNFTNWRFTPTPIYSTYFVKWQPDDLITEYINICPKYIRYLQFFKEHNIALSVRWIKTRKLLQ